MGNSCGGSSYDETDEKEKQRNPRAMRRNVCCTDIVALVVLFAFWVFLAFIAITSLVRGDAKRVIYGYDTSGNTCNQKNNRKIENLTNSGLDTSSKPYVFFMSTMYPKNAVQLCVEKCPDKKMTRKEDVVEFYDRTGVSLCEYGVVPSVDKEFSRIGPCPEIPIYKSIHIGSRCIPDMITLLNKTVKTNITNAFTQIFQMDDFLTKALSDLSNCWRQLIGLAFIGIAISLLMVLMMRFLASVIVWLIVALAVVGTLVGTVLLWWCFASEIQAGSPGEFLVPLIGNSMKKRTAFLIFAILATILTVVLLLILFIMRKRISLVVALFHEAGKCLADVPLLLIQPFWTFLIWALVALYFAFILACITTMGSPIPRFKNGFMKVKFEKTVFGKQFWWIHIIGFIWTHEFILACQEFVVASCVSMWYFSTNKKALSSPILKSIAVLITCHMGSIAIGSMIIAIVKIIRYILMYIESKCKGSENACARCCLKCCICCMWCLEKVLKYLHRNAYTVIAITGDNFCTSARKAFEIVTSNALRVAAINSVGDFVLFLGKVASMCLCGVFAWLWLRTIEEIHYLAVPIFLVCIFTYVIAHVFLSVYEMVIDALLICFCEDSQRNDGTPGREYFMSQSLMKFVTDSSSKISGVKSEEGEATALRPSEP